MTHRRETVRGVIARVTRHCAPSVVLDDLSPDELHQALEEDRARDLTLATTRAFAAADAERRMMPVPEGAAERQVEATWDVGLHLRLAVLALRGLEEGLWAHGPGPEVLEAFREVREARWAVERVSERIGTP